MDNFLMWLCNRDSQQIVFNSAGRASYNMMAQEYVCFGLFKRMHVLAHTHAYAVFIRHLLKAGITETPNFLS